MKKTPRSRHEEKAGITEGDLIVAFEQIVREEHPNPRRTGCPSEKELKQAASSSRRASQSVLGHIAECAHCLRQYDRLRRDAKAGMGS
jgi:hypothetical protein